MWSRTKSFRFLLSLVLMLMAFRSIAQQFDFTDRRFSNRKSLGAIVSHGFPDTIRVETDMWTFIQSHPNWFTTYKIKSLHDFAKFYVDNDTALAFSLYNYKVCLRVYYYPNPAQPNSASYFADTLSITNRSDSLTPYQDKHYHKFSNYHKIMLVIYDIIDQSGTLPPYPVALSSPPIGYTIPGLNCDVEAEIWQQKYDKSPYGDPIYPSVSTNVTSAYNSNKNVLKVNFWDTITTPKPTPALFELEWTYVDNYDYTIGVGAGTLPISQLNYDFKNNATRVITDRKSYEIPVVYERGYLVFRSRILRPDSVTYDVPIYTNWSIPNNSGPLTSLTSGTNYYVIPQAHVHDSLNWQYTVSFAEGGKYKQVMNYFDGSLKNRQTITKFNSQPNYTIATENIYDFKGRPAISILPTPVPDSNFKYIYGLDINSATTKPYKAADFDTLPPVGLCPAEFSVSPLDSTAWAYIYYSHRNSDKTGFQKFIPDAEGYPLVHTIIAPENDKRIFKQGGAGPKLQMADSNTTNYDYVMPEQSELNRLFGTEIGWSEYYKKTVVRDPNRQRSYSITDNEGRTVATGMIGLGPDSSTHPIEPYDVPGATTIKENLLDGNVQTPVNHIWSLDKSFYVDADGEYTFQYSVNVPPFPVCNGDEYLTIGASYDYKVFDNCGDTILGQADTLGVTGEWHTPVANNLNAAPATAYLGSGAYYLSKNMTYNQDSVGIAVDKFLDDTSTCLHNEDWFIRTVVESKNFPCPLDTSPCDARKRRMKEELWPGAKYGKYQPGFGEPVDSMANFLFPHPLPQNGFSIFDFICLLYSPPNMQPPGPAGGDYCAFRYQWCPGIVFPASVWKNGREYTHIANLPVDTFIYIFNDTIAEALLPLHPEYCKRCDSTADKYEALLNSIPDYKTAGQLGYLKLTDIISQDPLYSTFQAVLSPTQAFDSLAFPRFSDRRMDSICIALAFCGGVDSTQSRICYEQIFNSEVNQGNYNIASAPGAIQDNYFRKLIPLYIANRSLRKKILADMDTAVHCAPCDSFRMLLQPPGVDGPAVFSPTTTDSAMLANLFSGLDNGFNMPPWAFAVITGDTTNALDSVTQLYNSYQLSFCDTQVAQIARKLINCSTDITVINHIHDSLYNYYCIGSGINTPFTPEVIRNVIVHYAGSVNDLCNPYLVNLNPMPTAQSAGGTFSCNSSGYYLDALTFFQRNGIKNAINSGTPQSISLSTGNAFENNIITTMGLASPYTINVNYFHLGSNFYKLKISDSTNANDSLSFWFKKTDPVGLCANSLEGLNYWASRNVVCVKDAVGTLLPSMINAYSFAWDVVAVMGTDTGVCQMLVWNDRMSVMDTTILDGQNCIACSEIKSVYQSFNDTLNAYGVCCSDHPYYSTMLWNYINYNMKRQYAGADIEAFIASCALADSTAFRYLYGQFKLSGISAASIQTIVGHLNTTYNTSVDFFKFKQNAASTYDLILSFGNIPTENLLQAKNYIVNDSAGLSYTYRYGKSLSNDTLAVIFVPSDISNTTWQPALTTAMGSDLQSITSSDVTVVFSADPAATTLSYKQQVIKNTPGLPFYKLIEYSDTLNKILYNNTYGVQTFTEYNPFINKDYYRQEKKDFLTYNYGLNDSIHYMILRKLGADSLKMHIANYASKNVTYDNPYVTNDDGDLFVSTNQFADPGFAIADSIITCVARAYNVAGPFFQPSVNKIFFSNANQRIYPPVPGPNSGDSLNVYRCGDDQTYWYRYFKHNKLYNMYIHLPEFVQNATNWRYLPGSFKVGQGDGTIYRFTVNLVSSLYPGVNVKATGYTDFAMGTVLDMRKSLLCLGMYDGTDAPDTTTCERYTLTDAIHEGKHDYLIYRDSVKEKVTSDYVAFLDTSITEAMYLTSRDQKYQFTIYYYDRAGNLIRTVPPAGVNRMDSAMTLNNSINADRNSNIIQAPTMPVHDKASFYTYNSINNVVQQITPDGGTVNYYYDAVGRVVYSQNDVERPYGTVAYTLYDPQGRIIETGEMYAACPPTCVGCIPGLLPNITNSSNYTLQETYDFILGHKRSQAVSTRYDDESINLDTAAGMTRQQNLRKRVSAVKFFPLLLVHQLGNNTNTYTHATYYSYDIAGNVKTLTHDYPAMPVAIHRFKRVDYDYDVLSGKVNMLSYNRGFGDQFYQRYSYDADNRLTKAETSNDGIYWDDDADYKYYKHGPLARVELGDRRVQALDYAYTIQGWIKALNSDITDTAYDMGGDGRKNSIFPPDAFSYGLDYFPSDYKPIGDSLVMHIAHVTKGLYNGNITRQTTSLMPLPSLNKEYKYDPINRLTNGQYYNINRNSNNALTATDAYKNRYTYDEDGNFKTLKRYGGGIAVGQYTGIIMDSLTYLTQFHTNQLFDVLDSANNSYGAVDIQKKEHPDVPLFIYDEIGRMIQDRRTIDNQDSIHWSLYNKVNQLSTLDGPRIGFSYDGAGNRLTKTNYSYGDTSSGINTDYYVRDASGNILAILNYDEQYRLRRVPRVAIWTDILHYVNNDPRVIGPYVLNADFVHAVIGQTVNNTTLTSNILAAMSAPILVYNDPWAVLNPCIEPPILIHNLVMNGPAPLVHSLVTDMPHDLAQHIFTPYDLNPVITMDTTGGDTTYITHAGTGRLHTAMDYWLAKWPAGFDSLCHTMGIGLGDSVVTDSIRQLHEDSMLVYRPDFIDYAGHLLGGTFDSANFVSRDSLVTAWILDTLVYKADTFSSGGSGGTMGTVTGVTPLPGWTDVQWQALLRHLSDGTAQADSDRMAFALAVTASGIDMTALQGIAGTEHVLEDAYNQNPDSFLVKWLAAAPDSDVAAALASMPEMTAAKATNDMLGIGISLSIGTVLKNVLVSQRFGLSEHHLYGTSRLAVRDYAVQFGSSWSWDDQTGYIPPDSAYVNTRVPWRSLAMGDFMLKDVTEPVWSHLDLGKWYTTRILGLKRYELTSHLGDVQATVTDRTNRKWNPLQTQILATHADISTLYDYYPFGMPMPARTIITDSIIIAEAPPVEQYMQYNPDSSVLPDAYPAQQAYSLDKWSQWPQDTIQVGHLNWLGTASGLAVVCDTFLGSAPSPYGTKLYIPTDSGKHYTIRLLIDNNSAGVLGAVVYTNHPSGGSSTTTLATQAIPSSGGYSLNFTAVDDTTWLAVGSPAMPKNKSFRILAARMNNVIQTIIANGFLIPGYYGKRNYRFAYDAQEKVSEISGEGNHYTALFWEYDPRLAVRWNTDRVVKPGESPYAAFANNPLKNTDILGDDSKQEIDKNAKTVTVTTTLHYSTNDIDGLKKPLNGMVEDKDWESDVMNELSAKGSWSGNKSWTEDIDGEKWTINFKVNIISHTNYREATIARDNDPTSDLMFVVNNFAGHKSEYQVNMDGLPKNTLYYNIEQGKRNGMSFSHELGHIFGLGHNSYQENGVSSISSYDLGNRNVLNKDAVNIVKDAIHLSKQTKENCVIVHQIVGTNENTLRIYNPANGKYEQQVKYPTIDKQR